MPEGPEVKVMANQIDSGFKGKVLQEIHIGSKSRYFKKPLSNLDEFRKLLPRKLSRVYSRGKKIIFIFEGDVFMVTSLGMEGHFLLSPRQHSGFCLDFDGEGEYLYFDDSRHFGSHEFFFSQPSLDVRLSDLGLDLLNEEVTFEMWHETLERARKRGGNKQITKYLLDQDRVCGIGNYLRAEILYAARIAPSRTLNSLSLEDSRLLWSESVRILHESYRCGGHTLATYVDAYGNPGTFEVKVYRGFADPEGRLIKSEVFSDGRTTWWCPEVQI